jgi:transposase
MVAFLHEFIKLSKNFIWNKKMFIRVNKTPNSPRRSIQICQNFRKGDKVKQKIIHYVGIARDDEEEKKLKDYAKELIVKITLENERNSSQQSLLGISGSGEMHHLKFKAGRPKRKSIEDILPPSQVSLDDIEEEARIVEGVHDIAGKMFDDIYGGLLESNRVQERLRDVVLSRLVYPCSKRGTQQKLTKHFGKTHDLNMIYQMMDRLFPIINKMKQKTFQKTKTLFPEKIDLLLFDVTTLYFESVEVDELRNFGYSKDHRFNTTQVVLALATNQDGLPVGYELFEGNKAEVTTLIAAIESWKQLFNIERVCFVGDRAMFTKKNMALLESYQYHYIIAAKLKALPEKIQEEIFKEEHYRPSVLNKDFVWIGEFEYEQSRLIVNYKSKRALKDQYDRQRVLDKVKKRIGKKTNPNNLITNQGVRQFITRDENAFISLDENKIATAEQWDGLHGIITNIQEDSPQSLISRYARLWVIEESFRINKHNLEMRPIFHWAPPRIHAHIAICYMTFSVLKHLQYQVNLTQKISVNEILDELLNVQASIYVHKKTKDRYRVPGHLSNNARKIYKTFRMERSLDATVYLN